MIRVVVIVLGASVAMICLACAIFALWWWHRGRWQSRIDGEINRALEDDE